MLPRAAVETGRATRAEGRPTWSVGGYVVSVGSASPGERALALGAPASATAVVQLV